MPTDNLIQKLAKIKAHMESAKAIGSEQEAQTFAAMLQNLLLKHKLEMTDIEYSKEMEEEPIVEETMPTQWVKDKNGKSRRVYADNPDVEVRKRRIEWIEDLATATARYNSCQIMVSTGSSRIWFVGHKSNVAIAQYLFITLHRAADKLADKAYGERWHECLRDGVPVTECRGFRGSFLQGFVSRILRRFEEELQKAQQSPAMGTALVRVNKEALAVSKHMELKKGKLAPALGGQGNFNDEGYRRGKAAADGMNLKGNAINEGRNKQIGGN